MSERPQPDPTDQDHRLPSRDDPLVQADIEMYGGSSWLGTLAGRPDLIFRNRHRTDDEITNPVYEQLPQALSHLEEYGIDFPGIGSKIPGSEPPESEFTQIATQRVAGHNMHHEMTQVPLPVTMRALDGILRYYEDMLSDTSGAFYLSDLSLRQCVYGRPPGKTVAGVYFVDFDPYLSNTPDRGEFRSATKGLERDLEEAERIYKGQSFESYKTRLDAIKSALRGTFSA
jgi:hypothetical protein